MSAGDPVKAFERIFASCIAIMRGLLALGFGLYGVICFASGLATGQVAEGLMSGAVWCGLAILFAPSPE